MKTVRVSKKGISFMAFQNEGSKQPFVNKLTEAKLIKLHDKDVVVDIGAYIGEYTMWAAQFAKKIISYEPTPKTFEVLSANTMLYPNVKCVQAAIVGDKEKHVNLTLSPGVGVTNSIVKTSNNMLKVSAVNYNKAVKGATVVKIDCEGAEYSFDIVQPSLRAIILEVHPVGKDWKKNAKAIFKKIQAAGFKALTIPKFKHGWDMHATFEKV